MDIAQQVASYVAAAIWGWLTTVLLAKLGIEFPAETAAAIQAAMIVFFATVLTAVFGQLQKKFPWIGWFLLRPHRPIFLTGVERLFIEGNLPHVMAGSSSISESIRAKLR